MISLRLIQSACAQNPRMKAIATAITSMRKRHRVRTRRFINASGLMFRHYLTEALVDCHTQKVIAPIKRTACTQSLIGLPLSRIADAIIAAAHAIAHRMRVVSRLLEELAISCSPYRLTFRANHTYAVSLTRQLFIEANRILSPKR